MSVADDLRMEQRVALSRLSTEERTRLALELGLRDLELFMEASGLDRDAARAQAASCLWSAPVEERRRESDSSLDH